MDECVVVTGGGTGIGRAVALDQAGRGAEVVVVGRREGPLADVVSAAPEGRVRAVVADVSTPDGVRQLAAALPHPVTGLVTAAGGQGDFMRAGSDPDEVFSAWQAALSLNLMTAVLTAEAVTPLMRDDRGRVVLVSSTSSLDGLGGPYATAKAAVNGYARDLARRTGGRGVTVNVLAPGFTADTDFFATAGLRDDEQLRTGAAATTLVGRVGTSAEMAAACAWLLSAEAGFTTGQVVCVDGGSVLGR